MLRHLVAIAFGSIAVACSPQSDATPDAHSAATEVTQMTAPDFTAIDGAPLPFSTFDGKAVLVVNTASECGFTPQYSGLQALWQARQDDGLVIVGVPSNDFGGQEPGSEAEIVEFCEINFGVDFPLTRKTPVTGPDRHAFYAWAEETLGEAARPQWNFHKVLVGRDGVPIAAFGSRIAPDSAELTDAIDAALAG